MNKNKKVVKKFVKSITNERNRQELIYKLLFIKADKERRKNNE